MLVTTVQSLKQQGEGDLERGFANLDKHIRIVQGFGLPVVVAINRFPNDTEAELERCGPSARRGEPRLRFRRRLPRVAKERRRWRGRSLR